MPAARSMLYRQWVFFLLVLASTAIQARPRTPSTCSPPSPFFLARPPCAWGAFLMLLLFFLPSFLSSLYFLNEGVPRQRHTLQHVRRDSSGGMLLTADQRERNDKRLRMLERTRTIVKRRGHRHTHARTRGHTQYSVYFTATACLPTATDVFC